MEPNWTRRQLLGATSAGVGLGALISSDLVSRNLTQQARAKTVETGDWPQFGFDAGNTNYNPETGGPAGGAEVDWTYEPSTNEPVKSPVIASGSVYITAGNRIVALEEVDGTEQWVYDGVSSPTPPAVVAAPNSDTELVCVGHGGGLLALNASNGEQVWEIETESRVTSAPTVSNQIVNIGDRRGWSYQIDAAAGEIMWEIPEGGSGTCAVAADTIWFHASISMGVILLNRSIEDFEGTKWTENVSLREQYDDTFSFRFDQGSIRDNGIPMISDGTVYIPSLGLRAVDIENGGVTWDFDENIAVPASCTIVDNKVIFGSGTDLSNIETIEGTAENAGTIYALDKGDASVEWTFEANGPINTSPAATVRTVYVTSDDGTVYALSVFTGEEIWSMNIGSGIGNPVIANDRLFVGTKENGLVALVEPENTETATPTDTQSDDGDDGTDDSDDGGDDSGEGGDDSDENGGSDESEEGDGGGSDGLAPGFGVASALAGLGGASYLLGQRLGSTDEN